MGKTEIMFEKYKSDNKDIMILYFSRSIFSVNLFIKFDDIRIK